MKGWTIDGRPVELTAFQERAVRALLGWDDGSMAVLPACGCGGGKTTVIVTAARYERARARGKPLPGDPRRAPRPGGAG